MPHPLSHPALSPSFPLRSSKHSTTKDKDDYEFDLSAPTEVHRVPSDQVVDLTEEQKNEVFTKIITALDPNASKSLTRFDYSEGAYKPVNTLSHMVVHFAMDGLLIHVDSEEAKEQTSWLEQNRDKMIEPHSAGTSTSSNDTETSSPSSPSRRVEDKIQENPVNDRALKNQFNYSERGNQTVNPTYRDVEVATEPPPCVSFSGQVTHWEIFDTYCEHLEHEMSMREAKEKPKKKALEDDEESGSRLVQSETHTQLSAFDVIFRSESCALALKTMERLINQNSEAASFFDYKYSDEQSEANNTSAVVASYPFASRSKDMHPSTQKSTFLQLWKFSFAESAGSTVTSICFNPLYTDLFAAGYGSFEFGACTSTAPGLITAYTLKNSSHPEYVISTPAGVQCLDWHPVHPSLIVCGMINGCVAVYDIRHAGRNSVKPSLLYLGDSPRTKHTDVVWQVRWATSEMDTVGKSLSFFSISMDSRVTQWSLNKQELQCEDVIRLTVPIADGIALAGGTCFAFSKHRGSQLLVGTEEGAIHLYDRAFNTTNVRSFVGHYASVYALHFNPYHPGVFLSCSADWHAKVWEIESESPAMTFDLTCHIGDIAWSLHSATMFAVATSDGRLRVFDLSVNKYEAVSEMRVNKRVALTHVAFSNVDPILAVGDADGKVHMLKLSAMVRRKPWPVSGKLTAPETLEEVKRFERLLVLPSRENGKQPHYIKQFINNEERRQAGEAKESAEVKAAAEKAKAASASPSSPLTSPRKAAD